MNVNIDFEAEVIEVKARKTASLDKEIRITLITNSEEALKLQDAIANYSIKISAEKIK